MHVEWHRNPIIHYNYIYTLYSKRWAGLANTLIYFSFDLNIWVFISCFICSTQQRNHNLCGSNFPHDSDFTNLQTGPLVPLYLASWPGTKHVANWPTSQHFTTGATRGFFVSKFGASKSNGNFGALIDIPMNRPYFTWLTLRVPRSYLVSHVFLHCAR